MATPDYTAGDVMATAAALLNDVGRQEYTNTNQLPYLQLAFQELRERLQLNNVPVTNRVDTVLTIPAGDTEVSFVTSPALPENLIEIRQIWERPAGVDPWTPMQRREFLPYWSDGVETPNFLVWAWIDNKVKLFPASQDNDLKINYIAQQTQIVDENSTIGVINGKTFLDYRTAALIARHIGEDVERATELNEFAEQAMARLESIEAKAKQAIYTRRRPFRASWKNRGRSW